MKKGLLQVVLANIINLAIGLVNSFFLPKYLSVETYAMIKTYAMYITYAGFFHLGYLDGMYLKYGGKEIEEINPSEFGTDFKCVVFMQLLASAGIAFAARILKDPIILAFAFGILFNNIISCFQMLFQAVGEFKLYSTALNYKPIIALIGNLMLVLFLKCDLYIPYVICQLVASLVPLIYLWVVLNKRIAFTNNGKIKFSFYRENISSGFILMLGNFSSNFFTAIDRWFVKILMTIKDFAIYSFAVSVDALINVFITPIIITLYNFLCKEERIDKITEIKRMIYVWGFAIIFFAYPSKWFVQKFIIKYIAAVNIIFILFATQVFYVVIKGVYINMYKARKQQTVYFYQMIGVIAIGFVLNMSMYFIFKTRESIAIATFITALIWLEINERKNKEIAFLGKEILYGVLLLAVYFLTGYFCNAVMGGIFYIVAFLILSLLLMKDVFYQMIYVLKEFLIKKVKIK